MLAHTLKRYPIEQIAFILAIILYGILGSPTPNHPSIFEALIGLCLIVCTGATGIKNAILNTPHEGHNRTHIKTTGQLLLLYGLSIPLISALISANDTKLIIRDLIPFLFLCLPLFIGHNFKTQQAKNLCVNAILFIGICFGLRSVMDGINIASDILSFSKTEELTYLANSSLVLFSLIFLSHKALKKTIAQPLKNAPAICAYLIGALLCALPLILTLQRASLGYSTLALSGILAISIYKTPKRSLWILALIIGICFLLYDQLFDVFYDALHKTTLVGFNNRFEEWAAVWDKLSSSPLNVLMGAGWGASYHSPAVGGLEVNFTHSLLSSMLLKTGLIGCGLATLYLFMIGKRLLRTITHAPHFTLASFGAFIIPITLYASYKSLDFGLLLLLLCVYTPKIEST